MGSTMGSTTAILGTGTSRQEEEASVRAESTESNGEAEEDVLHKVFGQHLEVSRLHPLHIRRFIKCWIYISDYIATVIEMKAEDPFLLHCSFGDAAM
jgi:hypothetical protein